MENHRSASIFDAIVMPHRSLAPRGFLVLMIVLAAVSFIAGSAFVLMGAWPVFGFFGLDVLLVYVAFRANYRGGRAREEIRVTPDEVLIRKIGPDGDLRAEIRLNPYWVRVETERTPEGDVVRMSIVSHGARHDVAGALSPTERESFRVAFVEALRMAKQGDPA